MIVSYKAQKKDKENNVWRIFRYNFKSLKLDRNIFTKIQRYFGEAAIYFAGLIMILDGVAGAVAANTLVKTSIGISGLTAILTWLVWSIFIYVIGVKIISRWKAKYI